MAKEMIAVQPESKTPERIYMFDNLKFFLILTVVLGHFCDEYTAKSETFRSMFIFIYSFHMPLFIFVSGLLHKPYQRGKQLRLDKVLTYIMIGYALKLLIFSMKLVAGKNPSFQWLSDSGIPWFMFVLAAYEILIFCVQRVKWYVILPASLVIGCLSGYFAQIGDFLYLSRFLVFAPFFLAGYYLKPETVKEFMKNWGIKIAALIILYLFGLVCIFKLDWIYPFRYLFTGRHPFANVSAIEGCNALYRIAAYLISALACAAVTAMMPDKKLKWITECGTRTIQPYFWHRGILYVIMYSGIMNTVMKVLPHGLGKLAFLFMGVALTFFLSLPVFEIPTKQVSYVVTRLVGAMRNPDKESGKKE